MFGFVRVDGASPGLASLRAVVFVRERSAGLDVERVSLVPEAGGGVRFEPDGVAVPVGGWIELYNGTTETRIVHCSTGGEEAVTIEPGAEVRVTIETVGYGTLTLADTGESAGFYGAPGPCCRTSPTGRYEIGGLTPGLARIEAWHPQLQGDARLIDLATSSPMRVDLVMRAHDASKPGEGAGLSARLDD